MRGLWCLMEFHRPNSDNFAFDGFDQFSICVDCANEIRKLRNGRWVRRSQRK